MSTEADGRTEQGSGEARAVGGAQSGGPGSTVGTARRGRLARALFVTLGLFFVGLGVVGIVLPLIPTTAPLLLAAALFARSSPRFHAWLLGHRVFGAYIRNYREHRGMTRRHKFATLVMLWVGIGVSMYLSRTAIAALVVLGIVLVGVTLHILTLETAPAAKR